MHASLTVTAASDVRPSVCRQSETQAAQSLFCNALLCPASWISPKGTISHKRAKPSVKIPHRDVVSHPQLRPGVHDYGAQVLAV